MPKILVFSENKNDVNDVIEPLKEIGFFVFHSQKEKNIISDAESFSPDIAIVSLNKKEEDISKVCRKIKLIDSNSNTHILLLTDNPVKPENISPLADGYLARPIDKNLLISTINSHLRLKSHLDIFTANNSELAQRFYQLKVLYDTNSKLAGTLNPKKLINIMHEGLEQSISYSICMTLCVNNQNDIQLIIDSLYPLSKRLEQALKLRAITSYKALFVDKNVPVDFGVNDIKTEINYKNSDGEYDFDVLHYANIFSPISTKDNFFGTVEILREDELSKEDTTCFQTLVSQVALPLESALLYEEIREKNAKLEKLEKLKSEFVSIVSHELRTPLQPINNALDIILSGKTGKVTEKMENFLNMGKRNVKRLTGIINDLLNLSKIEAGKMEYRFERTDLTDPIKMVVSTFIPMAQEKNISLEAIFKVEKADVYADTQKIEQVLTNLVSNALKFTNEKGKVKIILSENKKHPDVWNVEVKDTGIGISEENLNKVFDKFQQIENSLSRKVGGTGLGLPIAKEFILSHRGNIWVESKLNKGTSFIFTLPKYDEYSNFLAELSIFYEKSRSANTNFGMIKIKTNNIEKVVNYFEQDKKYRKIFSKNSYVYVITQNMNKNLYEIYLEKLQDFALNLKNDSMLVHSVYCDFDKIKSLDELIVEYEKM